MSATIHAVAPPRLAIRNAGKSFTVKGQRVEALRNVSLTVDDGEFVSLVGPSGCGKSTLLNVTAGLATLDEGQVLFDGAPVARPNQRVGYLTQDDALLPWRNVLDNVALPLEIKGLAKRARHEAAKAMIDRVGLVGFEHHLPSQLSGGMRKRVGLARTLIYDPVFLLLDEPFGALDAQTRSIMQRELLDIVRKLGLAVMLVTHDLAEAIALSDRILLFSRRPGRIIETVAVTPEQRRAHALKNVGLGDLGAQLWARLAEELGADEQVPA